MKSVAILFFAAVFACSHDTNLVPGSDAGPADGGPGSGDAGIDSSNPIAPTVTATPEFTTNSNGATNSPEAVFDLSVDPQDAHVTCTLNGAVTDPCPLTQFSEVATEGSNEFTVTATLGDLSGSDSFSWIRDTSSVSVEFDDGQTLTNDNTPSVSFTVTSTTPPSLMCTIDSDVPLPCTSPFQVPATLIDGSHDLLVSATNDVGTSGSATLTFAVDTTAPTVTIDNKTRPPEPTDQTSASIAFIVSDPTATVSCTFDGVPIADCTSPISPPSPFSPTKLTDPPHVLAITAADEAGNVSTPAQAAWHVLVPTSIAFLDMAPLLNPSQPTPIQWKGLTHDDNAEFAGKTTFIPGITGDYLICLSAAVDSTDKADVLVAINGVPVRSIAESTHTGGLSGCSVMRLASGVAVTFEGEGGTFPDDPAPPVGSWLTIDRVTNQNSVVEIAGLTQFSASGNDNRVLYNAPGALDGSGEFDIVHNSFKPKAVGNYLVCASISGASGELALFLNSARVVGLSATHQGLGALDVESGCYVVALSPSDSIDLRIDVDSSTTFIPDPTYDWLTIDRLATDHDEISSDSIGTGFSSPQTTSSQAPTVVPYAVPTPPAEFTAGTFTAPSAGAYLVCASAFSQEKLGFDLDLVIDGAIDTARFELTNDLQASTGCRVETLATGHKANVQIVHGESGDLTFNPSATQTWLTIDAIH